MADHLIFHECTPPTKEAIQNYWQKKQQRFEKLLVHFPEDQRNLRLTIRRCPERYEAHAVLTLPTGTLVAETNSHGRDYLEALDIVADRLVEEIRRHKDHLSIRF